MVERRTNVLPANGRLTDRISIGVLARVVSRELVDEVLAETGRKEQRIRLLPAHVVVYFVVAMAVFRDGYEEVTRKLVDGLRFVRHWSDSWSVPTTGAITQANAGYTHLLGVSADMGQHTAAGSSARNVCRLIRAVHGGSFATQGERESPERQLNAMRKRVATMRRAQVGAVAWRRRPARPTTGPWWGVSGFVSGLEIR